MHRTLPYISLFVVTVLLQVFLFDNLSISIYLNPLVYVAFVALLPLDTPPWVPMAPFPNSSPSMVSGISGVSPWA